MIRPLRYGLLRYGFAVPPGLVVAVLSVTVPRMLPTVGVFDATGTSSGARQARPRPLIRARWR